MTPLRRGHANGYRKTHDHIAPSPTSWVKMCGRCGAKISGPAKPHRIYSFVCKDGCAK